MRHLKETRKQGSCRWLSYLPKPTNEEVKGKKFYNTGHCGVSLLQEGRSSDYRSIVNGLNELDGDRINEVLQ